MKKSKILFSIFITFFLTFSACMGEVFKLKFTALSIRVRNEKTKKWSEWSNWEPTNVLIVVDTDKGRIKIFSAKQQVYDIVTIFSENYDEDGDLLVNGNVLMKMD